ncbi:MAG: molecular chaperone DjiA [Rhodospirillaceae bacterium]|nr:molecular chaperone DjiA [Rhodospirillaceae bacterium]
MSDGPNGTPGRALTTQQDAERAGEPISLLGRMRDALLRPFQAPRDPTQTVAFTIAIIALAAKMAKADGHVSQHEIAVFRELFRVPVSEQGNLERVFDLAKRSVHGYDSYAKRLRRMLGERGDVLERVLDALFIIACADEGPILDSEVAYLRSVAELFGFDEAQFEQLLAQHAGNPDDAPYAVLGVHPSITDESLKEVYRRLVRDNHPDRLSGMGVPGEFITLANERLARINNAFHRIRRARASRSADT